MALTQTDLENLDKAIASGLLMAVVDGKTVQYRSQDELIRARSFVANQIAGTRRRSFCARATFEDTEE